MDSEQIEALITQLKAQGLSEDEIMEVFYETFTSGKMDRKDLETLAEAMGYELTDDFKNEETPDPIEAKGEEGLSKEELEDAKAIEPGESTEEFKEKIEDAKDGLGEEEKVETEEKSEEEAEPEAPAEEEKSEEEPAEETDSEPEEEKSEEEEWEEAQKLFKI